VSTFEPLSSLDHSKDERDGHRILWLEAELARERELREQAEVDMERKVTAEMRERIEDLQEQVQVRGTWVEDLQTRAQMTEAWGEDMVRERDYWRARAEKAEAAMEAQVEPAGLTGIRFNQAVFRERAQAMLDNPDSVKNPAQAIEGLAQAVVSLADHYDDLSGVPSHPRLTECPKPDSITWQVDPKTKWARDAKGRLYYNTIGTWHKAQHGR
jgi:hypothetical protein